MSFTPHPEGDPGKLEYLHNGAWRPKLSALSRPGEMIDPRACPGCIFGGKEPHVQDDRCEHFRTAQEAVKIEAGVYAK